MKIYRFWCQKLGSDATSVKALVYLVNDYTRTGFIRALSHLNISRAALRITKLDGEPVLMSVRDAIAKVVVRRVTGPDIPNAVGKNWEGDFWIIVPT